MFILTKDQGDIESGAYATMDNDGVTIVQFFVDKDDALTYNEQLKAVGYDLHVTETPDDSVDKLCDLLGYAYTIAEPGEIVVPRTETLLDDLM
jgi:hypothetical protein